MKMCKTSSEELEKVSGDEEGSREGEGVDMRQSVFMNSQAGASPCTLLPK